MTKYVIAVDVLLGLVTTAVTSSWLASRQVALDLGLSRVEVGNVFVGGPPATLTFGGWLVFTLVFAGAWLVGWLVVSSLGWMLLWLVRWANGTKS